MLEKYEKAGKIAAKVRKQAAKKATAGMKVIDLIDWIDLRYWYYFLNHWRKNHF